MTSEESHVNRDSLLGMHSNTYKSFLKFKSTFTLVPFSFNSSIKLFQVKINTLKLKPNLLLNASLCICPLTFLIETL